MRTRRTLSALLALALLLGCMGWTPTRAEEATLETNSGTVTENIQALDSAEKTDILQQEEARGKEHIARLHNEEGLNQHIYLNRDGSKTMYLYDHPVKYLGTDGKMQDISLEIAQTEDARYPYRTKANSAVTSFPADMADGIRLEGAGVSIRLAAQMPVSSGKNPLNRNARQINGEKVAYTYDAKTSIEYSLTYAGFKEDIVVSQYTGQTEYQFTLYTNGLTLTELGGSYYLTDAEGTIKASIGEIIVFTADEKNNTMGQLLATTVEENQVYNMTIVLDGDYLADPDTVYPIRIDPTVNICYQYSGPTAIEDMTIHSEGPSDHTLPVLHVGLQQDTEIARALMKFPGLDFDELGSGLTINSATVYLYDVLQQEEALEIFCNVYPIAWEAETFSGESDFAPAVGQYVCRKTVSYTEGLKQSTPHYYGFDITAAVRGWLNGTYEQAEGIVFKAHAVVESGNTYISKTFASYNSTANRPKLTINYTAQQAGPAVPELTLSRSSVDVCEGQETTISAWVQEGVTVEWYSSNVDVATVNNGTIIGKKAGTAVITVYATNSSGNKNMAYCTVYVTIPDGVYYIRNYSNPYYLTVDKTTGLIARQSTKVINYPDSLWQIWRVVYLKEGYYHIRPMGKLDYALKKKNTGATADFIGDTNTSVVDEAKWLIEYEENGYIFRNKSNVNLVLRPMDADVENIALGVSGYNFTDISQKWIFEDAPNIENDALLYEVYHDYRIVEDLEIWMGVGERKTLSDLGLLPTAISKNSISQDFVWGTDNNAVQVNSETGTITAVAETLLVARVSGWMWFEDGSRAVVGITVHVGPIPGGNYYIRNRYSHQYASAETSVGSNVTQKLFVPEGLTSWNVSHTGDGYYTIRSTQSGSQYYLGVKEGEVSNNRGEIVLCSDCSGDNTRWKIELLPNGAYKLTPKSSNYVLAVESKWPANPDKVGKKLRQLEFVDDDDYTDEWLFCAVSDAMKLEAQETGVSCWAASSRMMVSIFMDSQISQKSLIVYINPFAGGIENLVPTDNEVAAVTFGGSSDAEALAINYLLGLDKNNNQRAYATKSEHIYSKAVLQSLLDDGYPVLINRGTYIGGERVGGHASVIYDYFRDETTGQILFSIYDPWPQASDNSPGGQIYHKSYEWICDSTVFLDDDNYGIIGRVWDSAVVFMYCDQYSNTKRFDFSSD